MNSLNSLNPCNKALCCAMLLPTAAAAQAQQAVADQRPNILYIMSDDHAYQAISAYGTAVGRLAPTPNIDRIANEGMRFDNAFVENSLSSPSLYHHRPL